MTCQSPFSGKNKNDIVSLSSAELAQSVVKVRHYFNTNCFIIISRHCVLDTLIQCSTSKHSWFWKRRFLKICTSYEHDNHPSRRNATIWLARTRPSHLEWKARSVLVCICLRFQASVICRNKNSRKTRLLPSKAIDTAAMYIHTATGCKRCRTTGWRMNNQRLL